MKRICDEVADRVTSTYPFYKHQLVVSAAVRHHIVVKVLTHEPLPLSFYGSDVIAAVAAHANETTRLLYVRSSRC